MPGLCVWSHVASTVLLSCLCRRERCGLDLLVPSDWWVKFTNKNGEFNKNFEGLFKEWTWGIQQFFDVFQWVKVFFFGQLMRGYFVCHESLPTEPKDVPRSFENVQVMEASANSASQVPCWEAWEWCSMCSPKIHWFHEVLWEVIRIYQNFPLLDVVFLWARPHVQTHSYDWLHLLQ